MHKLSVVKSFGLAIVFLGLSACGGGGGSNDDSTTPITSSRNVSGGGVKGPLANAIVKVYALDASKSDFKGAEAATASTNASAAIVGLALPFPVTPPYILEFTSDPGTTDITTGAAPVITTMRTVITQSLLDSGEQIYATPLTTMAVDIAIANSNPATTTDQFKTALTAAAAQVVSTLGFGMDSSIDIFDTPPLVDDTTASVAEQADVAAYRTAVEAVTAIAFQINQQSSDGNTDSVLSELSADLADGGGIDGSAGTQINTNTLQVLQQDPASLPIPNSPTGQTVGEVQAILVAETATTGSSTATTELEAGGSITTTPKPAETNPDSDGDGSLNVDDAFPNNPDEDTDSDGDGIGDNADSDDNNNGILDLDEGQTPAPVANDTDQDGVEDSTDNCPAIFNPSQTNTDAQADGGDACDSDDDDDAEPDATDAFPFDNSEQTDTDRDGLGDNVADSDDDDDGIADVSDTGVAPAGAPSAGVACSLLRDCDGDGVFDGADFDPVDPTVTLNFAPIANADSVTVDEDAATFSIAVTANDTDNDGNPNDTVDLDSIGSNDTLLGVAVINGNNIDYTPVANASGTDTFTYTVTDGSVTATASVSVTVNAANDVPVITQAGPLSVIMDEDGLPTAFTAPTIDATDAENDALTWTLGTGSVNGTATVSGSGASPAITYSPNGNFGGSDSFTAIVSDGVESASITVNVTVRPVNDPPEIAETGPLLVTMSEDGSPTVFTAPTISATDTEGDALTWSLGSAAANGTATVSGTGANPIVNYTPNPGFSGSDSFDVSVSDGAVSATITVDVTVDSVNDAPVITQAGPLLVTMSEDGSPTAFTAPTISATDAEGDTLAWSLGSAAANGAATVSGTGANPTVNYTPNQDFSGSDSFDVSVSDGAVSATITINVTVDPVNDMPVANDDSVNVLPDATVLIAVLDNDSDAENSTLTPTFGAASAGSVTDNGDGRALFDATGLTAGTVATFTYTVNDGDAESNTATVTVTVTTNQAPVITQTGPLPVTMSEDGSPTVFTAPTISATDTEGDTLSWDLGSAATSGTAMVSGTGASPTVTYTPNQNFVGSDSFDVRVSDATGSTTITINVTVDPVNDAPVIAESGPLPVTMSEDGSPTVFTAPTISATDTDGDTLTWTLSSAATNGTATVSGTGASTTVTYTPNQDFSGADNFDVSVSDGVVSATITVTITVDPVNDDPVAVDDSESVSQNGLVIIDVLANDSDVENDALTIAVDDFTDAANGTVTQNGDDTFDYVPNPEYLGADSFTYTVSDGNGGSATGTVNITVNPSGVAATVANLLDVTQGGGVGAVESWNDTLPEFEYWRDTYDATAGTLSFIDEEYDYATETFVDVSGFDSYWLTSTGTWELPSSIDVVTPNDGDGSMVVAVRDTADTENVANLRIRASIQDIDGDLISDYLDANWAAQMLNPAATFGTGAQLVTSYTFESLMDAYSFELEDWCETENPARWTALNNSCNGVFINTTSSYASSLAELQVSIAWTDTETNDDSGLDVVSMSYDESTNSELLAELVVAGNVVNYYVRDYDLTGTDYIIKLVETSTWSLDSVSGVMMIRFTIPAALESQFPDLGDEGGLSPFFTEFGGFVRGGVLEAIGSISADDNILNGIALDEVLANFDAPAAPDVTELIGTWVSNATSFNGDSTVLHYFSSFYYEVSGTCDNDSSIGLEYGTMTVNAIDGTFTTSTSVNGRGSCSLADVAGPGTTLSVNGDTLTLDVSGEVSIFSRLKGDLNPLVGSWLTGDITVGGDGGHVLLTFFDDSSYMHSEDCSIDGIGTEYGSYTWDEGGTNQVTSSQVYDANGGNPGCGLSENTGDWEFAVTGDTLTVTVPGDGSFDFTRHSPTFVPLTPPIMFVDPGNATLYNVELDDDTGDWVMQVIQFDGAGGVTVDVGGPTEDAGTYEVIGGILEVTGSGDLIDYIMIMSTDATSGADRVCWTDPYADLVNCTQPGDAFLFDDSTAANDFLAARVAGATFSGSAVNASAVFAASGLFVLELDGYYDAEIEEEVDELLFFELTADGVNATDDEYLLENGSWVPSTDYFDIALTSTGWKANVDWRFDTSLIADPAVTLSNVEAGETLTSLTATFSEMAIDGQPILDFVDTELAPSLVNGMFTTGARVYETSIMVNNDYYYLNNWGSDCDDGSGGNYNGNCNVAQQRTLNRSTGELTGFTVATDASFVGDNTATIELGWNGSMSLVAVFVTGGVLEFWEVNWSVSSNAALSGSTGTWTSEVVGTETLVTYVVPVVLQNSYQVQGDADTPAVFLSQQNGYMRFGELEDEAGQTDTIYFFNDVAFEDINNNIPGIPTLP
jgi:hypothetical protein